MLQMLSRWLCPGLLALNACQYAETGKSCAAGVGLRPTPYNGEQLADHQLAWTFDGAAGPVLSEESALLADNGIFAAFFVSGESLTAGDSPALMTGVKARAHLVGNHGFTTIPFGEAVDPEREVRQTDRLIAPYVTGDMFLLRPSAPLSAAVAARLNKAGLSRYVGQIGRGIGDQTLVTDDQCWERNLAPAACAEGYLNAIKGQGHGLVRLHSDDARSTALLRLLLAQLKTDNFSAVRLDADPEIKAALLRSGATPDAAGGAPGCSEY